MSSGLPNIVFLVLDCGRADRLGCYGYERGTTPNIDAFAADSTLYTQAISAAGWTLPSHASMFTGTYPSRHGAHNENHYMAASFPTLAEMLARQGYQTTAICYNDWLSEATGLNRGFAEHWQPAFQKFQRYAKRIGQWLVIGGRDDWGYEITQRAKKFVRQRDTSKPFFLFMHLMEMHLPFILPPSHIKKFLREKISVAEALQINQDPKAFYAGAASMSERDFRILSDLYDAALHYVDALTGEFLRFLKKMNLLDDTIFVITADHGESLGEHNKIDHYYTLYETLIHVPLLIRFPGVFPARSEAAMVQTLDLYPTLLQLVGVPEEAFSHSQGVPLPPVGNTRREFAYAERFMDLQGLRSSFPDRDLSHLERFEKDRKTVVRTEKYKLIHSSRGEHELFDLQSDPRESKNIYEARPEIAGDLAEEMERWKASFEHADIRGEDAQFDTAQRERLKALGYLG